MNIKKTLILLILFINIFPAVSISGLRATAPETSGATYSRQPYLHKDVQLLSQYLQLRLLSLEEVEYTIQYTLWVDKEEVENPFLYVGQYPNWNETKDEKGALQHIEIATADRTGKVEVLDRKNMADPDWDQLQDIYQPATEGSWRYLRDHSMAYAPVTLYQGEQILTVRYKAKTEFHRSFWNHYCCYHYFDPGYKGIGVNKNVIVEIILEDPTAYWWFQGERLDRNNRTVKLNWEPKEDIHNFLFLSGSLPVPWWVRVIEALDIENLFWASVILLLLLHIYLIGRYRKRNMEVENSPVAWKGAILVAFLQFIILPYTFSFTYNLFAADGYCEIDEWIGSWLWFGLFCWLIIYIPLSGFIDSLFFRLFKKVEN